VTSIDLENLRERAAAYPTPCWGKRESRKTRPRRLVGCGGTPPLGVEHHDRGGDVPGLRGEVE
jgi:hypothetical protein